MPEKKIPQKYVKFLFKRIENRVKMNKIVNKGEISETKPKKRLVFKEKIAFD
ncbi:MAG: hypothetical protein ACTSQY_07685 [Candidatus Odinarchaeia archaeon]